MDLNEQLAQTILSTYAPDWADMPLKQLVSTGTDNAMFRLGSNAVLRVPKRASAVALLMKELDCLPNLEGLPLLTPKVLDQGVSTENLGSVFGIFEWLNGDPAEAENIADPHKMAHDLGTFLTALQNVDTVNGPVAGEANHNRGEPIHVLSDRVQNDIDVLSDELNVAHAHAI